MVLRGVLNGRNAIFSSKSSETPKTQPKVPYFFISPTKLIKYTFFEKIDLMKEKAIFF